jgi:hypothetical protein
VGLRWTVPKVPGHGSRSIWVRSCPLTLLISWNANDRIGRLQCPHCSCFETQNGDLNLTASGVRAQTRFSGSVKEARATTTPSTKRSVSKTTVLLSFSTQVATAPIGLRLPLWGRDVAAIWSPSCHAASLLGRRVNVHAVKAERANPAGSVPKARII